MLETLSFRMLKNTIMTLILDLCRRANSKPWIRINQEEPENNLFSFSVDTHRFLPTFKSSSHTELNKDEETRIWEQEQQQQTRNQELETKTSGNLEQTSTGTMSFSSIVTRPAKKAAQGIYYSTTRLPETNDEETSTASTPNLPTCRTILGVMLIGLPDDHGTIKLEAPELAKVLTPMKTNGPLAGDLGAKQGNATSAGSSRLSGLHAYQYGLTIPQTWGSSVQHTPDPGHLSISDDREHLMNPQNCIPEYALRDHWALNCPASNWATFRHPPLCIHLPGWRSPGLQSTSSHLDHQLTSLQGTSPD